MEDLTIQWYYLILIIVITALAIRRRILFHASHKRNLSLEGKIQLLEMVLDNIKTTVYAKDTDGRFLYVNNEWLDMTGHSKLDVIGKTDNELCGENLGSIYWGADKQVIESMEKIESEESMTIDNNKKTILSIKVPMMFENQVTGICGIGTDISQMKLLQDNLAQEKEKTEQLLLNVLPKTVAEELRTHGTTKTEYFDQVGVLFSDICDFTRISSGLPPDLLIEELNDIFTQFDYAIEDRNCERIKTIGDAYMAVCGIPKAETCYANYIVDSAIDFIRILDERALNSDIHWKTKIGIHAGPVVGGVVGVKKYIYDIFGSTVNMASRLQSATKIYDVNILISDSIYKHIDSKETYCIREIDKVRVKGEYDPITLYEVFDCDKPESKRLKHETLELFQLGRQYYTAGDFDEAMKLFRTCKQIDPGDKIISIYIKRCATMRRLPRNEHWEGISGI